MIASCLRYLYEDNLFIGIQRVKLFKYPELGQYRFLALVLTLVLRHSMFVDIFLIYLTPQCRVIHFQELVRIATTLPPSSSDIFLYTDISLLYLVTKYICDTKSLLSAVSQEEVCRGRWILMPIHQSSWRNHLAMTVFFYNPS